MNARPAICRSLICLLQISAAMPLVPLAGGVAWAGSLDKPVSVRAAATADDSADLCQAAIRDVELTAGLPLLLLDAIGLVESGRTDPHTNRTVPWPWTINVAGEGRFFETKTEAIAAVEAAHAAGIQSIDVGCLQVNLMYHPAAFASLDEAFDPHANAVYAAAFLNRLHAMSGDWSQATGAYHSLTPGIGDMYQRRVVSVWPLAGRYGVAAAAGSAPPVVSPEPRTDRIDPSHVLTQELRDRLVSGAAADHARWVKMGLVPLPVSTRGGELASKRVASARMQRASPGG